ncbi:metallophosphoesterase [Nitritalea halalkaliphila LW7]|uniref:Metallophosphoesterase n=1 Tax=Nitritalea halalkaliphila LW7 TaxID=1189621 RepID=I5C4D0_9BACT|nr:metallophosphoesterase [Nitritalea halalkaliphila]EIM76682.1 metallophosphoesterase [Nitritalea halalkaliphila LW7]
MNRRAFLRQSLLTGTGLGLAGIGALEAAASPAVPSLGLHLLHTNDMHSRIDPFPMDGGRNAGKGGMTRLAALVDSYRKSEEALLLLDAGDFFQGTPYFNVYRGELELKLMSRMGYDASTLGNHEFDNGLEGSTSSSSMQNSIFCAQITTSRAPY